MKHDASAIEPQAPRAFVHLFWHLRPVPYRPDSADYAPPSGPGLVVIARELSDERWAPVDVLDAHDDALAVARIAIADHDARTGERQHYAFVMPTSDPGNRRHFAIALRSTLGDDG